jgi:dCMP deaminase
MTSSQNRPTWDEYFLILAKLAAIRSTCIARQVGAVIVKNKRVLATGYNGPPSGSIHCIDRGYCYPGLPNCDASKIMPSRAIHAEANAIAQAAKHGISTEGASIYVTLEPCLSCLKLIISAGISEVYYETCFNRQENFSLRDDFIHEGLITLKQIRLSKENAERAALILTNPDAAFVQMIELD